jgi:hypothetical protein
VRNRYQKLSVLRHDTLFCISFYSIDNMPYLTHAQTHTYTRTHTHTHTYTHTHTHTHRHTHTNTQTPEIFAGCEEIIAWAGKRYQTSHSIVCFVCVFRIYSWAARISLRMRVNNIEHHIALCVFSYDLCMFCVNLRAARILSRKQGNGIEHHIALRAFVCFCVYIRIRAC